MIIEVTRFTVNLMMKSGIFFNSNLICRDAHLVIIAKDRDGVMYFRD